MDRIFDAYNGGMDSSQMRGVLAMVGRRRAEETNESPIIPLNLVRQAEEAFPKIERPLRDGTLAVKNQRLKLDADCAKLIEELLNAIEQECAWAKKHKQEFEEYRQKSEEQLAAINKTVERETALHKKFSADAYVANKKIASLEPQVAELQKEKVALQSQVVGLQKEKSESQLQVAKLQKGKAALQSQVVGLQKEKSESQLQVAVAQKKIASLQNKLSNTEKSLLESQRSLTASNTARAAEIKAYQKISAEICALKQEVTTGEQERAKLLSEKSKVEKAYDKLSKSKLGRLTLRYWEFKDRHR